MSPLWYLWIVAPMALAVVLGGRLGKSQRRRSLQAWADAHGFGYVAGPCPVDEFGFDLACLRQGARRAARNVLEGTWRGRRVLVFDLEWSPSDRGNDWKRRLVAVTQGAASNEAMSNSTKDVAEVIATAFEAAPPLLSSGRLGAFLRTKATALVAKAMTSADPGTASTRIARLPGIEGVQVECGRHATATLARPLTSASQIEQILDFAATLLDPVRGDDSLRSPGAVLQKSSN